MKETLIHQAYEIAKERYAELGIDTEKVLEQLQNFHLSMHCWQADDVKGFEVQAGSLDGGIAVTGNFPGAARSSSRQRASSLETTDSTFMKSTETSRARLLTAMK